MTSISLPLNVGPKGLSREEKLKKSIDSSISLILSTAQFSTPADPQFGFVFNKNEGVVYDSGDTDSMDGLQGIYDKKISGSSKSINTFASELKESVAKYERRLEDVTVSMTYIREERQIYITVKGVISSTKENYVYKQIIRIWN